MDEWVDDEVAGCDFPDERLKTRFAKLLLDFGRRMGRAVPYALQDWAATKAAYRFFDNPRVDEATILAGHFAATSSRFAATDGTVLVLHDTTEFSFQRIKPELIGQTCAIPSRISGGAPRTMCGILMHSSLVVTPAGLPLGLAAVKFWTREKFKGTNALKTKVNPTRIPIEHKESVRWLENLRHATSLLSDPPRCIHIGDRESDIFELFCAAREVGTHFLVRTCVDRLAQSQAGDTTISKLMAEEPVRGVHEIVVQDSEGQASVAKLDLRYCRIPVRPPIGKQKRYPTLSLTVIHAFERVTPQKRERIEWKLLTDLDVDDVGSAVEKLNWYAQRWKIETFHKIMKSGCGAEKAKLRTADRLTNLLAIYCIVGWRVFWLTMLQRNAPEVPAIAALTDPEIAILRKLHKTEDWPDVPTVAQCVTVIAKLGGYLARGSDPPPGNLVIWRGLSRLTDIHLGFELALGVVGN